MPQGGTIVVFIALAVGGAYYGGKAVNDHVVKPVYHKVVQPVGRVFHHKHKEARIPHE